MTTLRLGVFNVGKSWRFYQENAAAESYDYRPEAVSAACRVARSALGAGEEVELYLQDIDGELRKVDPRNLAH